MKQIHKYDKSRSGKRRTGPGGQRGGLTIFSAALVLILMTMVLVYATRVSVVESRISGNEVRQKEAFHVAESALDEGMMYLLSNSNVILSSREDAFGDGTPGSFTKDGWLSASNMRWKLCSEAEAALTVEQMAAHPCGGDVAAFSNSYYYETDNDTSTVEGLPVNDQDFPVGTTARMSALLCFVELGTPIPCKGNPGSAAEEADSTLILTLLAYGYSDCTDTTDITTCTGEATIAMPISNYNKLAGPPAVPFVSKSTVGHSGTVEVVGNPNGGGIGVPVTTWLPTDTYLTDSSDGSSWQTCELQEWYGIPERPEGVACTINPCRCGPGGNDTSYFLSWNQGGDPPYIGIDIIEDPDFPPDLFDFNFGVPRELYWQVKNTAQPLDASDCGNLGPDSKGLIWINGGLCTVGGNVTVGSLLEPVIIVSAADKISLLGGSKIFGLLYIFDGDLDGSNPAELKAAAGAVVYGAVVVDGSIDTFGGGFAIVYNEDILTGVAGIAGLGSVNGGWRDFGLPDIVW